MPDQYAFAAYLRSLPIESVEDVISSLEAYEDQFGLEHVVPATVVLLNLLPALPYRQSGMFEMGTRFVVGRVVYRLLRAIRDHQALETAIREILPQVESLSSKLVVITAVGYRENAGHKLISEAAARALELEWRYQVRAAKAEELAQESELFRIFYLIKMESGPDEPTLHIPDSPDVTYALLKSARSETRSQTSGSRVVRREPRLAWDILVELYGDEATLRQRIEALKSASIGKAGDLLELTEKYLSGWRPDSLGEN